MKIKYIPLILILSFLTLSPLYGVTKNIEINADSFELDANKNIVEAIGNVTVFQKDVTISGDRSLYNQNMQTITIYDNILIKRKNLTMTCKTVVANEKNNIIEAKNNISFSLNDIKGIAQYAKYDISKQIVIFTGNPQATQGANIIKGSKIIIDLNRNKIITKGNAKAIISSQEKKK